jgi:CheY-like chemotaxis protein
MSYEEPASRPRVLIVDDEESTRLLLARLLSTELKLASQLAGTCEQALRLAGEQAYDLITLDLIMPGIGGLEVLKKIRAGSPNARTPVIVVSIVGDQGTIDQCIAAGASAYHVKPVRRAELVAAVRQHLAARTRPATLAR